MTQPAIRENTAIGADQGNGLLRAAGLILIVGAVLMVVGAALYFSTGLDLWESLETGTMTGWVAEAGGSAGVFYANLSAWAVGSLLLGLGGALAATRVENTPGRISRALYGLGPALSIPAFVLMATTVRVAAASPASVELADALGFAGTRLDDLATALLVGFAPLLLVVSAGRTWVPRWLRILGYFAGVAAAASLVTIFTGYSAASFLIVPIGLGWTVAAGVVAIRTS